MKSDRCISTNENFISLVKSSSTGNDITEASFQEENGVLQKLRNSHDYSSNYFPDDHVKNEIPLKIWSRSTYNWKLSCESQPETSLATAI